MKTPSHLLLSLLFILPSAVARSQGTQSDYERADNLRAMTSGKVFKDEVEPHWFDKNRRFWYRNALPEDKLEFVFVDAKAGTRELAFDHERLAQSLAEAAEREVRGERLPFETIEFTEGRHASRQCVD
ncbi:MAG: hypothetical protein H6823_05160 [Planctomycetaceae bacterium]|nr:hypothetical protein [Planctomycetales bacterium]MCB9937608.1 hypothetical protein [Planctomycetaceae bacterium]